MLSVKSLEMKFLANGINSVVLIFHRFLYAPILVFVLVSADYVSLMNLPTLAAIALE